MISRFTLFVLVAFAIPALAKSTHKTKPVSAADNDKPYSAQDIRALCADPSKSKPKVKPPNSTEAGSDCIECLVKSAQAKSLENIKTSAEQIEKNPAAQRDLAYFKSFGGPTDIKVSEVESYVKDWKKRLIFYKIAKFEETSPEYASLQAYRTSITEYAKLLNENKKGSPEEAKLLDTAAIAIKLYQDKIQAVVNAISDVPSDGSTYSKSAYQAQIDNYKSTLTSLEKISEKIKSDQALSYSDIANAGYATYGSTYNEKETLSQLSAYEIKLAKGLKAKELTAGLDESALLEYYNAQTLSFMKMNSNIEEGVCGLSPAEMFAIYDYTAAGYDALNQVLRTTNPIPEKYQAYRDTLLSGLKKLKSYSGFVKRGVSSLPDDVVAKHKVGNIVTYDAFTSTSTGKGFEAEWKFVIKSKTGKFIAPMSTHPEEKEVLFGSGARFKILNIEKTPMGGKITMEEVSK